MTSEGIKAQSTMQLVHVTSSIGHGPHRHFPLKAEAMRSVARRFFSMRVLLTPCSVFPPSSLRPLTVVLFLVR